jgi:hypothetical protein
MRQRLRSHLTYANVMATIAVFLVLSGGTAVALSGSNTVQSDDLGPGSQVTAPDVAANAVNGSDVMDFSLSNQDVGVLFAEVNANGTLANSSGGVTSSLVQQGIFAVDFGRNVTACTAVANIGPSGTTSTSFGFRGETNVADATGNAQAVWVRTNLSGGGTASLPFRVVVVC